MPSKYPNPIPKGDSVSFVAPEIMNYTGKLSPDEYLKSDVYSLGIILYQLNFLQIPTQEQIDSILTTKLYRELEISYGMMDLLQRMLCKDPTKRITAKQALVHQVFLKSKTGGIARFNTIKRPSKILQTIVERTFDHSELTQSYFRSEDDQKQHTSYYHNMQQTSDQNILQSVTSNQNIPQGKDGSNLPLYSTINQQSGGFNSYSISPSEVKKNVVNVSNSFGANSIGNSISAESQNFIQYPSHSQTTPNPGIDNANQLSNIPDLEEDEEESITKESSFEDNNQQLVITTQNSTDKSTNTQNLSGKKPDTQKSGTKSSQKNSKIKESKEVSKLDTSDEMTEQDDDFTYCAASHLMKENIRRAFPQYAFISQLPVQKDKLTQIK